MEWLQTEVIKAARESVSWRDLVAKYSLHRLNGEEKNKLRFLYNSNLTKNGI